MHSVHQSTRAREFRKQAASLERMAQNVGQGDRRRYLLELSAQYEVWARELESEAAEHPEQQET